MPKVKWYIQPVLLLCLFGGVPAALGQGSQRVVKASGYLSVDAVKPASKFNAAIVLEVSSGYHINSHVPSLDYLNLLLQKQVC